MTFAVTVVMSRNPWEQRPRSRLDLYLVMWPFFGWWTMCAMFAVLARWRCAGGGHAPLRWTPRWRWRPALAIAAGPAGDEPAAADLRAHGAIAGLPAAFAGYRIAQISDLHCGPFTPPARVSRWVDEVNALGADLIAVTGDLITSGADYVPAVAACLGELRAPDGVAGLHGQPRLLHRRRCLRAELERQGLRLLRNRGVVIERPGGRLYIAGVDDTWTRRTTSTARCAADPPASRWCCWPTIRRCFPAAAAHGIDSDPVGPHPRRAAGRPDRAPALEPGAPADPVHRRPLPHRPVGPVREPRPGHHRPADPAGRAPRDRRLHPGARPRVHGRSPGPPGRRRDATISASRLRF